MRAIIVKIKQRLYNGFDAFRLIRALGIPNKQKRKAFLRKGYPFPMLATELLQPFFSAADFRKGTEWRGHLNNS